MVLVDVDATVLIVEIDESVVFVEVDDSVVFVEVDDSVAELLVLVELFVVLVDGTHLPSLDLMYLLAGQVQLGPLQEMYPAAAQAVLQTMLYPYLQTALLLALQATHSGIWRATHA